MLQFLYNNFSLDLTNLKVTFTDVNPWFEEELSSEYSFPFNMPIKDWQRISNYSNYNTAGLITSFVGKLYRDGDIIDATLKIQESKGEFISGIIYAGLDGLTVLDVQLKDLPLDVFNVINLKDHALEVIKKNYPDVNYNFPMIHTDKYDPDSNEFHNFEMIINKFGSGKFIENSLDLGSNIDNIRNIMQPLPYLMHVIEKGFSSFGFKLEGDILQDADFKKALIFRDGEYFETLKRENIPFRLSVTEWKLDAGIINGKPHVYYEKEIVIEKGGDYIIKGNVIHLLYAGSFFQPACKTYANLSIISNITTNLYTVNVDPVVPVLENLTEIFNKDLDFTVTLKAGDKIRFDKIEPKRDSIPSETPDYPEAVSLEIIPIRYRNPDGSPIITMLDINQVDLKRVVPDMSFTDLISILRIWKNYGFIATGKTVRMDYIEKKIRRDQAKDLSDFDIEEPVRVFHDERSFELKFTDGGTNEKYKYDSIFVSKQAVSVNNYRTNKNTTSISIDALYYPVVDRNGVVTAHAFDDDTSKLRLVFFRAVPVAGSPVSFDNLNLSITKIYENYYSKWLNFRVNSIAYQWDFIISVEKFREIQMQSLVYAFKNYHILTEVEKERITQTHWRVSAKSECW